MGRELFHEEPVFREVIEQCDELLRPYTGWSLKEQLLADEATETDIAQPALFSLQVALAALCLGALNPMPLWGIVLAKSPPPMWQAC